MNASALHKTTKKTTDNVKLLSIIGVTIILILDAGGTETGGRSWRVGELTDARNNLDQKSTKYLSIELFRRRIERGADVHTANAAGYRAVYIYSSVDPRVRKLQLQESSGNRGATKKGDKVDHT